MPLPVMTAPPKRPVVFYGVNSEGMGHATRARPWYLGKIPFSQAVFAEVRDELRVRALE